MKTKKMSITLNEYCLYEIFRFLTPLEWIQVSKVCSLWKITVSRLWEKVSAEIQLNHRSLSMRKPHKDVSIEDAQKILILAAPFSKRLEAYFSAEDSGEVHQIVLGSFCYQVVGHNLKDKFYNSLRLFAINAKKLTEIKFVRFTSSQVKATKALFDQKQIKKLTVDTISLNTICTNNLTSGIEDLVCHLLNDANLPSFSDHFPSLLKLELVINGIFYSQDKVQRTLAQILPHVIRLKALSICLLHRRLMLASGLYNDILKLTQLEKLELGLGDDKWDYETLVSRLPQLQVVFIRDVKLSSSSISSLLSLRHLRIFYTLLNEDSCTYIEKYPKAENISELYIGFQGTGASIRSNVGVVKQITAMIEQMPNLKLVGFNITALPRINDVVCSVLNCVRFQNKKVVITAKGLLNQKVTRMLVVKRTSTFEIAQSFDEESEIFDIVIYTIAGFCLDDLLLPVKIFLSENMKDHQAFIQEGKCPLRISRLMSEHNPFALKLFHKILKT